jgi:hypothetical protein
VAVVAPLGVVAAADDDVAEVTDDLLDEVVPEAWFELELEPPQPAAAAANTAATIAGVTACVRTESMLLRAAGRDARAPRIV